MGIKRPGWQAADVRGGQDNTEPVWKDGELRTLITLAKEITQSSSIRKLPQGKDKRAV